MTETSTRTVSGQGIRSALRDEEVQVLWDLGERQEVDAETRLAVAGSSVERVWLVLEGHVHLRSRDARGGQRTVAVACSEGMVGDIPLFRGGPHTHDLLVGEVPADLVGIEAGTIRALTHRSAGITHRWMRWIICRLEAFERRALLTATVPLRVRLAALLLDARRPACEGGTAPTIRLSQQTIADLLGASRPAVTRAMGALREDGLIETAYRCIEVRDVPGLVTTAGDRPGPRECPHSGPRAFLA